MIKIRVVTRFAAPIQRSSLRIKDHPGAGGWENRGRDGRDGSLDPGGVVMGPVISLPQLGLPRRLLPLLLLRVLQFLDIQLKLHVGLGVLFPFQLVNLALDLACALRIGSRECLRRDNHLGRWRCDRGSGGWTGRSNLGKAHGGA